MASGRLRCALLPLLAACGGAARDHGPAPDAEHQATVRAAVERMLGERHELDGTPACRFAAPVPDRVPRWHFEPEVEGKPHSFGNVYGWRVDVWVTPSYVGYPAQPEAQRMAFFAEGRLRGLFAPGGGSAPLELDRWSALWVDPDWQPVGAGGAPQQPARPR
jgi:hypothetical protein